MLNRNLFDIYLNIIGIQNEKVELETYYNEIGESVHSNLNNMDTGTIEEKFCNTFFKVNNDYVEVLNNHRLSDRLQSVWDALSSQPDLSILNI